MPFLGLDLRGRKRIGLESDMHLFHSGLPDQHQCLGVRSALDHLLADQLMTRALNEAPLECRQLCLFEPAGHASCWD